MGTFRTRSIYALCSDDAPSITSTTTSLLSAAPAAETQHIDSQTKDNLEKQLNQRPDRSELVDRNILKGA